MACKFVLSLFAVAMAGCSSSDPGETIEPVDQASAALSSAFIANNTPFRDPTGFAATVSTAGFVDLTNEFFQNLGSNGRRCVSCHLPSSGWTITPPQIKALFDVTLGGALNDGAGLSAIFRTNDGSNAPSADVSTLGARRKAYSQLLTKGLIRVGLGIPAAAEFELLAVDDPYRYASAAELSLFRRPLPATNLKFLSAVMWDGRETFAGQTIHFDLSDQANAATTGHAQGNSITGAQRESIVAFETGLHTAQVWDDSAGALIAAGATGGPNAVVAQPFYLGINDLFGDSQTGAAFNPVVFSIYDAWSGIEQTDAISRARRAVARGETLFNTKPINIAGVSGINDEEAFGNPAVVVGTCTTCHDSPNGGDHSVSVPLNIGLADASRRTADMPLYTLRNLATGETVQVTDPGRALITGKWKHIGRFKGPILRGLASRAPYFHNGSAADLGAVIDFYESRFTVGFTAQEKSDLIAFLRSL